MPSKTYQLTCLAFDATPKNVRLAMGLAAVRVFALVDRKVYLINAPRTIPIPTQVLAGVEYGNNGNEFTGTYSPGAGGNTYSRGRVVNE